MQETTQELMEEIATCRRDPITCRNANVDVIGLKSKRALGELAVLLATLADDLEGRLEPRAAAFGTTKRP